jgi:hypothetical protein
MTETIKFTQLHYFQDVTGGTSTTDGKLIVLTLSDEGKPYNLALPSNKVIRLFLALSESAKAAKKTEPADQPIVAFQLRNAKLRQQSNGPGIQIVMGVGDGLELVPQIDLDHAKGMIQEWAQGLGVAPAPKPDKTH